MLDMKVIRQVFLRTSAFKTERCWLAQGNTAVYLLYTHTRVSSILCRAEDKVYK